jgi:hypothetical protein
MNHLYVTFEDTTGVRKEIDVSAAIANNSFGNDQSEEDYIQTWVNAGMRVISTRYAAPGEIRPPSVTPSIGSGCLLSILSIFGI